MPGLPWEGIREISLATGQLAFPYLKRMSEEVMQEYPGLQIHVYEISKRLFRRADHGVRAYRPAGDIDRPAEGKGTWEPPATCPEAMYCSSGAEVFLDDVTGRLYWKTSLQVPVNIVKSSGYDLVDALLGISDSGQE